MTSLRYSVPIENAERLIPTYVPQDLFSEVGLVGRLANGVSSIIHVTYSMDLTLYVCEDSRASVRLFYSTQKSAGL